MIEEMDAPSTEGEYSEAARREAVVEQISELEGLTKSRAWGMLVVFIEDQVSQRVTKMLLTPIKNEEDMAEQNYTRGECAFGKMLVKFVTEQLKVSRETVELYKQTLAEKGDE